MRSESFELTGPVLASVTVEHGHVLVRGDSGGERARVTLAPMVDGDQVAAALIERATVDYDDAGVLRVVVPPTPAGGVSVVRSGGGMVITQNVGSVHMGGSVTGVTIVNGRVVSGGTTVGGGGVRVTVTLPEHSTITATTVSAGLDTSGGELEKVCLHTTSGDLRVGMALTVTARTVSGDVTVDAGRDADVRTTSGDVEVAVSTRAEVATISGDVDVLVLRDGAGVTARTISGDIRVTPGEPGISIDLSTSTVTGRVRGARGGKKAGGWWL